ncbi:MAG TPA: cation diffusion facilitator family transporter [Alphaproteobacteria bacterium]|jgi:cobalt-zinc-cadmium efflux system protein|nr:cation transporter [Magnetococcales bacterium]MAF32198.1 cation transporter [Magnetococcales bacterium]MAV28756.1 cation transporter [Legionellales bacterium]MAY98928.1 cation transporter [Micavibrio sp.]HRK98732.1 cation diffusion facilitator family transporter [Alphaproteobacteria bacterium]|tara:strand:+ start:97 stop:981 length:885 start_codon:yes stop_codon:yes gene_type:complete
MGHSHHHGDPSQIGERRLWWAVSANILLTVAQVIGGILSGSLSLVADALHNFSDAASLLIALVAIRIGRKPPDQFKTFGYKRAETVAALINLTTLIIIGLYLCYEAIKRFITPEPVAGWTVVIVAGIALAVDVFTALLTYRQSKTSMNIKAAFLHNVTDAMASVGVIITGTLILLYGWVWTDAAMTLIISGYVLWQGFTQIPKVIHLLMEGAPDGLSLEDIRSSMEKVDGVNNVHHVHVWQLDEHRNALEAHVVLEESIDMDTLKIRLKKLLHDQFEIEHSTLEFEYKKCSRTF